MFIFVFIHVIMWRSVPTICTYMDILEEHLSYCPVIYSYVILWHFHYIIQKTYPYDFEPFIPHFYIVKLGFTGVYIIFHISAQSMF